jgi:rod shape-determining protein MreB
MDQLLTKELGVPAYRVDNPTTCVAEGAARALSLYPLIRRNLPPV